MNRVAIGCLIVLALVACVVVAVSFGSYNRMVALDEQVSSAWGQVENAYQRRADLVPNLVATVSGAANFEQTTLENVTNARAKVGQVTIQGTPNADQLAQFEAAQGELSSALSRLLAVVENYPQLQATANYRDLQAQLEGTENRITQERRHYNEAAQAYNTARRSFPTILVAGLLGFHERAYFQADTGAEQAPPVNFSTPNG